MKTDHECDMTKAQRAVYCGDLYDIAHKMRLASMWLRTRERTKEAEQLVAIAEEIEADAIEHDRP